jgi:rsbT co-antagonist protein RsbR
VSAIEEQELAALRRRVAELEREVEACRSVKERLVEIEDRLHLLLDSADEAMGVGERGIMQEVNHRLLSMFGYTKEEVIGKHYSMLHPPEVLELIAEKVRTKFQRPYEVVCVRKDGSTFLVEICGKEAFNYGRPARVVLYRDMTVQKEAEQVRESAIVQREMIRAQEALLAALSTPLLPIEDDVLVLPLIGAVNAERATQVIEALVEGVARSRAKVAILDITGVPDVDAHVAAALLTAARSVQLLGARVILTGIRPDVAQRIVALGTDLRGITTYGTLQRGVARAREGLRRSRG